MHSASRRPPKCTAPNGGLRSAVFPDPLHGHEVPGRRSWGKVVPINNLGSESFGKFCKNEHDDTPKPLAL